MSCIRNISPPCRKFIERKLPAHWRRQAVTLNDPVQVCSQCAGLDHASHNTELVDKVSASFGQALQNAVDEISQKMRAIQSGIEKIKAAREAAVLEKKALRKTVQTYYDGYANEVRDHRRKLEQKINRHELENFNLLLREELQLG